MGRRVETMDGIKVDGLGLGDRVDGLGVGDWTD
jgi:hypothetical protein